MLYFNETMILLTHTVMQTTYIQTESGCSIPFWISGKIQTNIFPYGKKSLNPFLLKIIPYEKPCWLTRILKIKVELVVNTNTSQSEVIARNPFRQTGILMLICLHNSCVKYHCTKPKHPRHLPSPYDKGQIGGYSCQVHPMPTIIQLQITSLNLRSL